MSGAAITSWLATGARLLLAVMGSAVALLISAVVIAAIMVTAALLAWSRHPLPILERRGSLEMSAKLPGIVLLASLRNARNSLSGATPMALAVE